MDTDEIIDVDKRSVDDSESSDDDSSIDNDNNEEYKQLVDLVWNKQDKNHDSYDIQKEVLDAVLNHGDTTLASYSIQIMSNCFPLAPDIWKKYIELQTFEDDDMNQITALREIYSKALSDYYSQELQQNYLTLCLKCGIDTVRTAFEEALTREGLHPLHGYQIWESYRLYESSHLSIIEEDSPEQQAQLSRLADIIIRQLSTPLKYEEDLYSILTNLSAAVPNLIDIKSAEKLKIESSKLLEFYLTFENPIDEIKTENSLEKLSLFSDYISAVQNRSDSSPKFIESLYYRATTEFCLNTDLWKQFCLFALSQKKSDTVCATKSNIDHIIYNALRNVPWSTEIWVMKIRWQEYCNGSLEDIKSTLEKALAACSTNVDSIWMAYLEYLKRNTDFTDSNCVERLRNTFTLCIDTLNMHWRELASPVEIIKYWARLEYTVLKDPSKGRELWNDVLGYGNNKSEPYIWLEMAKLEEGRGIEQARKIYRRAVLECANWMLRDAWLAFERMYGSLESLEKCFQTCEEHLHTFSEINVLKAYQEPRKRKSNFNENKQDNHKRFKLDVQNKKREILKATRKSKSEAKRVLNIEAIEFSEKSNISKKTDKGKSNESKNQHADVGMEEGTEISNLHISPQDKRVQHDPSKDDITIFVSNLDYTITKEQLESALKEKGELNITETRLVTKPNGTNKGYAYIELHDNGEVEKALKMDRTSIHGRPVYISSCQGDKQQRKHVFQYSERLEKNKLFIKGLSFDVNVDELKDIFGKFGELKDVRIVTYKNGKSKGLAFVEYNDENAASAAILQTDNMILKNHTISVALSAPPPRKNKSIPGGDQTHESEMPKQSLGAGTRQTQGLLMKAKISFIPRSVQKAVIAKNGNNDVSMEPSPDKPASENKSKSNDDFRKMLLGNK